MSHDEILVFKISPHHYTPSTTPRDWHSFTSVSLIAGLICIERWSYGKYPMPIFIAKHYSFTKKIGVLKGWSFPHFPN